MSHGRSALPAIAAVLHVHAPRQQATRAHMRRAFRDRRKQLVQL
jgi:hypothetical protein